MESKSKDLLLSLDMLYCRRYRGSFYASSDENAMEDIDKNETRHSNILANFYKSI